MDTDELKALKAKRVRIICARNAWMLGYVAPHPRAQEAVRAAERVMLLLDTNPSLLPDNIFEGAPKPDKLEERLDKLISKKDVS